MTRNAILKNIAILICSKQKSIKIRRISTFFFCFFANFTSNYQLSDIINSDYPRQIARTKNHKGFSFNNFLLDWGNAVCGSYINIAVNLSACKRIPPIEKDLKQSDQMNNSFIEILETKNLANMHTKNAARCELIMYTKRFLSDLTTLLSTKRN